MNPHLLKGRKKKPREPRTTEESSNPRNRSPSRSSSQYNDESTRERNEGYRPPSHAYAQSMIDTPVDAPPSIDPQRSYSADQAIGVAQNSANSPLQQASSGSIARQQTHPAGYSVSRSYTDQNYFNGRNLSTGSIDNPARNTNPMSETSGFAPSLFRRGTQSDNSEYFPLPPPGQGPSFATPEIFEDATHHIFASRANEERFQGGQGIFNGPLVTRWELPNEMARNRENSVGSPRSKSGFGESHLSESEEALLNSQESKIYLTSDPTEQESWKYRASVEPLEGYENSDNSMGKTISRSLTLQVGINDYRHSTSTTRELYQESLPSSSQSSRNGSAVSRKSRYPSIEEDGPVSSPSSITSYAGSDQRLYPPPQVQYRSGSISRPQETRWVGNNNTAFVQQVDVWQDGYCSPNAPPKLNNRTLLLDTQCRESNWISRSIVKSLCANTRRLPENLEFTCVNGGPMIASEETTLCFRAVGGGMTRTSDFFVALVEVPFDILLGADDIVRFDMLRSVTTPPFMGLIPRKQSKDERKQEPIRIAEQISRAEEHERKRKESEQRHKEREREQQRQMGNWSQGSEGGSGSSR